MGEVRVVSPPQAPAEDHFSPPRQDRRGTPTTSASRRRQQRPLYYEDVANRPRSNPRTRTPMRFESPMEHDAFRRTTSSDSAENGGEHSAPQNEARRITIRPMAGSAVGSVRAPPTRVSLSFLSSVYEMMGSNLI
jgi:hypothetical protein